MWYTQRDLKHGTSTIQYPPQSRSPSGRPIGQGNAWAQKIRDLDSAPENTASALKILLTIANGMQYNSDEENKTQMLYIAQNPSILYGTLASVARAARTLNPQAFKQLEKVTKGESTVSAAMVKEYITSHTNFRGRRESVSPNIYRSLASFIIGISGSTPCRSETCNAWIHGITQALKDDINPISIRFVQHVGRHISVSLTHMLGNVNNTITQAFDDLGHTIMNYSQSQQKRRTPSDGIRQGITLARKPDTAQSLKTDAPVRP